MLFNFAIGVFIARGCHEWTTLLPSKDCKHNIGKCRFTRVVMYYIFYKCILCWHNRSLSWIKGPSSAPRCNSSYVLPFLRGAADKSLARPGRKQATVTKLGIYSTYSPPSSIHVLACCSNFCKPLKKNQNVVRPTRSPRQQRPTRRTKNGELSIVFFSPENRW